MNDLVTCPACQGRGSYCLRQLDPVWPQLTTRSNPCELCSGMGIIAHADFEEYVQEYVQPDRLPYFPYRPYDY